MVKRLLLAAAFCLAVAGVGAARLAAREQAAGSASSPPSAADIDRYRNSVERVLMTDRGGTTPGVAACVMCHTWQTRVRFTLETPASDAGWTIDQSRKNFDVVTKLINTAAPATSRLLLKPLDPSAGGMGHTGGSFWKSRTDPEYLAILSWISSLPADRYVAKAEPPVDFEFFRACVQPMFANPREGHIKCSNCHAAGLIGFAPAPQDGKAWSDQEAKRAFATVTRLIIPGNPEQSRFLLKPLHPDGGGSYTHNGPRRWPTRNDPEWQLLAQWVRGERKGANCS
jgi:hypothetical protein